jgi:uncharacterized protein YwgA
VSNGLGTEKCVPIGSFFIKKRQCLLNQSLSSTQKLAIYESLTQNYRNAIVRDNLDQYLSKKDPFWKKQNMQVLAKLVHLKDVEKDYLLAHFENYGWYSESLTKRMEEPAPKLVKPPLVKKMKNKTQKNTIDAKTTHRLLTKLNHDWDILIKTID